MPRYVRNSLIKLIKISRLQNSRTAEYRYIIPVYGVYTYNTEGRGDMG